MDDEALRTRIASLTDAEVNGLRRDLLSENQDVEDLTPLAALVLNVLVEDPRTTADELREEMEQFDLVIAHPKWLEWRRVSSALTTPVTGSSAPVGRLLVRT